MGLALYENSPTGGNYSPSRPASAHAGLWYDKFFAYWDGIPAANRSGLPNVRAQEPNHNDLGGKAQWIDEMAAKPHGMDCGDPDLRTRSGRPPI